MVHRNAPLSDEGRRRLIQRCRTRPIAHVALEMGISRACASKWVNRYRREGEAGLADRSSRPYSSPTATPPQTLQLIEAWRRQHKWSATRITLELTDQGITLNRRTVTKHLTAMGLGIRKFIDPTGEVNRKPGTITALWAGHMVHVDVKKVGKIPDGGGWRLHGRGTVKAQRVGYTYLHSAIDGYSRLAYTEPLPNETAATAAGFWTRAQAWFAAHGIHQIDRVITDNGPCYRAEVFTPALPASTRHQRTRPYTPRHNGKIERYNRILAEELLYARPYLNEQARNDAITTWNVHYNYHRPHSTAGNQPPATRLNQAVTNVRPSYN